MQKGLCSCSLGSKVLGKVTIRKRLLPKVLPLPWAESHWRYFFYLMRSKWSSRSKDRSGCSQRLIDMVYLELHSITNTQSPQSSMPVRRMENFDSAEKLLSCFCQCFGGAHISNHPWESGITSDLVLVFKPFLEIKSGNHIFSQSFVDDTYAIWSNRGIK